METFSHVIVYGSRKYCKLSICLVFFKPLYDNVFSALLVVPKKYPFSAHEYNLENKLTKTNKVVVIHGK